jgi:putative transposase
MHDCIDLLHLVVMPSRPVSPALDEYYHVYNRGVDRRDIFTREYEFRRFQLLLYLANGSNNWKLKDLQRLKDNSSFADYFAYERGEPLVAIGAYCLLTNHFHLLVKEIREGGIATFMQRLTSAYSHYFNSANDRSGALFEGRYKLKHADSDPYLKYLFSYIHLNPLGDTYREAAITDEKKQQQIRSYLEQYPFASYRDYVGSERVESKILSPSAFPAYFQTRADLDTHITDYLAMGEQTELYE